MDIAAAHHNFVERLANVKTLQVKVNEAGGFDDQEQDILFESMFLSCYRALENLLEDCFVCGMQGLPDLSDVIPERYAFATNRQHARDMLMGGRDVLDWTKVAIITKRYDVFFKDRSASYYVGVTGADFQLEVARCLRNHIAHNSDESALQYRKTVIRAFYPTEPLHIPTAGALLRTTPKNGASARRQIMSYFHEAFLRIGTQVVAAPAP